MREKVSDREYKVVTVKRFALNIAIVAVALMLLRMHAFPVYLLAQLGIMAGTGLWIVVCGWKAKEVGQCPPPHSRVIETWYVYRGKKAVFLGWVYIALGIVLLGFSVKGAGIIFRYIRNYIEWTS